MTWVLCTAGVGFPLNVSMHRTVGLQIVRFLSPLHQFFINLILRIHVYIMEVTVGRDLSKLANPPAFHRVVQAEFHLYLILEYLDGEESRAVYKMDAALHRVDFEKAYPFFNRLFELFIQQFAARFTFKMPFQREYPAGMALALSLKFAPAFGAGPQGFYFFFHGKTDVVS